MLIQGAAASVKPLSLELGGHAPVLVFADADLDAAVEGTLMAKFRNTGQSCIAANRVFVERAIYERFLEAFVAKARALNVGDGLEPGVDIGPAVRRGRVSPRPWSTWRTPWPAARACCAAAGAWQDRRGFFFEPTVLADVPPASACMREETFAPIAPVCAFDSRGGSPRARPMRPSTG